MVGFKSLFGGTTAGFGQTSGSEYPGYVPGRIYPLNAAGELFGSVVNLSLAVDVQFFIPIELFEDVTIDRIGFYTSSTTFVTKMARYDGKTKNLVAEYPLYTNDGASGFKELVVNDTVKKGIHFISWLGGASVALNCARISTSEAGTLVYRAVNSVQQLLGMNPTGSGTMGPSGVMLGLSQLYTAGNLPQVPPLLSSQVQGVPLLSFRKS
jgi:hypothetical protein